MASTTKECRVCGKEYEACRSTNRKTDIFRWQDVACSPECGEKYFAMITESRNVEMTKRKMAAIDSDLFDEDVEEDVDEEIEEEEPDCEDM